MSGLNVPFTSVREPANECVSIGVTLPGWLCRSTHRSPRGLFFCGPLQFNARAAFAANDLAKPRRAGRAGTTWAAGSKVAKGLQWPASVGYSFLYFEWNGLSLE